MLKLQDRKKPEKRFVRRIQILRERVLLRKFAYLFFRKTISKVLPSTADNYYLKNIKRKAFLKLKMNLYIERFEFKHNLRAELHYNFVLRRRYFKKIMLFCITMKTERLKISIAQVIYERNFRKRTLKSIFTQWKSYATYKNNQKLKELIADQHFKNRCNIECFRPYFVRWRIFTVNRKMLKLRMNDASRYYFTKLLNRVFNAFFSYVQYRQFRKNQIERALKFRNIKLKQKMFNKLISYKKYKAFQRDRLLFVNNFCKRKTLQRSLHFLWKNVQRRKFKRYAMSLTKEKITKKMKKISLECWRTYVVSIKQSRQKLIKAIQLYDLRCKKKFFRKLKVYRIYRKEKTKYQIQMKSQLESIFHKRMLNVCFKAWKYYTCIRITKNRKVCIASDHFEKKLLSGYFRKWFEFKEFKKVKRKLKRELDARYCYKLLRHGFITWKIFIIEKHKYNLKMQEASKYYHENLVRENFRVIIKAAFLEKDQKVANYLEIEKRRLILAQKYLEIWKTKTKNCKLKKHKNILKYDSFEPNLLNINTDIVKPVKGGRKQDSIMLCSLMNGFSDNFNWDPMCFAAPRVPDYLRSHCQSS